MLEKDTPQKNNTGSWLFLGIISLILAVWAFFDDSFLEISSTTESRHRWIFDAIQKIGGQSAVVFFLVALFFLSLIMYCRGQKNRG